MKAYCLAYEVDVNVDVLGKDSYSPCPRCMDEHIPYAFYPPVMPEIPEWYR